MSDLIVPNIICFQTEKQLAALNNIGVLLNGVLIDLRTRNFMHAKTYLRALNMHARLRARNLSSPDCGLLKYLFEATIKNNFRTNHRKPKCRRKSSNWK